MSETLRELFGTPEELKPVPVPVAAPVVVEAPQVSLSDQRRVVLKDKSLTWRDKLRVLRRLRDDAHRSA